MRHVRRQAVRRRELRGEPGHDDFARAAAPPEVDRAADGLLTFLMNFLDQGQLTDGRGDTVDARRAIIVMTTNVGTDTIAALEGADDALLDAEGHVRLCDFGYARDCFGAATSGASSVRTCVRPASSG